MSKKFDFDNPPVAYIERFEAWFSDAKESLAVLYRDFLSETGQTKHDVCFSIFCTEMFRQTEAGREALAIASKVMGSAGGKKSRRTISPEQQRKMQEARRKAYEENVSDMPPEGSESSPCSGLAGSNQKQPQAKNSEK